MTMAKARTENAETAGVEDRIAWVRRFNSNGGSGSLCQGNPVLDSFTLRFSLLVLTAALAAACAPVAPYQRGYLARPDMAFDDSPGNARALEKTYSAKEAASGGASVGGGGCGCN